MLEKRAWQFSNALTAFMLACIIYLMFRQSKVLTFLENSYPLFAQIRQNFYYDTPNVGLWCFIKYYLPDMLWGYAFSAYVSLCNGSIKEMILLELVFSILFEFFQYIDIFAGTGDFLDILVETIGSLLAVVILNYKLIFKKINKTNNKEVGT